MSPSNAMVQCAPLAGRVCARKRKLFRKGKHALETYYSAGAFAK
jgi:hypothetical protein